MENETSSQAPQPAGGASPDQAPEPRPFVPVTTARPIASVQGRTPDASAAMPSQQSTPSLEVPATTVAADPTLVPSEEANPASTLITPQGSKEPKPQRFVWLKRNKLAAALLVTAIMGTLIGTTSALTVQGGKLKKERAAQAQLMREKQVLHNNFEAYKRAHPDNSVSQN